MRNILESQGENNGRGPNGRPVRRRFTRHLPGMAILAVVIACVVMYAERSQRTTPATFVPSPTDVDLVLKSYHYSEKSPERSFVVQGQELVRRGTMMLGLRSNLQKTTTLSGITGRLHSRRTDLEFSAEEAEWETSRGAPLFLKRGVVVRLAGVRLADVDRAIINLREGRLTTFGAKKTMYRFE